MHAGSALAVIIAPIRSRLINPRSFALLDITVQKASQISQHSPSSALPGTFATLLGFALLYNALADLHAPKVALFQPLLQLRHRQRHLARNARRACMSVHSAWITV